MGKMRLVMRQRSSLRLRMGRRLKLGISQRQIMSQRRMLVVSTVCMMGVLCWVSFFNLSTTTDADAATQKFSMQDGEWSAQIWSNTNSTGPTCNCDPGSNYNGPGIAITHIITSTVYDPLKISGGGIVNISATGRLDVYGKFELNGGSTINIENSDSVIINGDLTVSGASVINTGTSGYLVVHGNVVLSGGSKVVGPPGRVKASGSVSGTGWQVATLPIQLIYFLAKPETGSVALRWATASEKNNDYFSIERSIDGNNFEELLKSPGAGNSSRTLTYSGIDINPVKGNCYYRLKQTDFDGNYTYSKVVSTSYWELKKGEEITIQSLSPNPFTNHFSINYATASSGNVEIQVFNNNGICVLKQSVFSEKGNNCYLFSDSTSLETGIYYVSLFFKGKYATKKILKV